MSVERPELTYRLAGVDIDAGNALVERIKPAIARTKRPGVMGTLGGFGALFDLKAAGYKDPLLVSATDGVGTKLKIAIDCQQHSTIGIDLVAMCVNDLIVHGAEPLFFLDYFASAQLSVDVAASVIEGISEGCRQAGSGLVGGETAEMPGLYQRGDYDLAGFVVGAVERDALLPSAVLPPGARILGLSSSGLHSNGFSLVHKIVRDHDLKWSDPAPFEPERSLADALLEPTRIYVQSLLPILKSGQILALAHITGGGLLENLPRSLPEDVSARIDLSDFELPSVFKWLATTGPVGAQNMLRTFNCGIGMVLIVDEAEAESVTAKLQSAGEGVITLGQIEARKTDQLIISNMPDFD